ncbi:hypothetical protein [Rhodanobacter lindaniclasticus]
MKQYFSIHFIALVGIFHAKYHVWIVIGLVLSNVRIVRVPAGSVRGDIRTQLLAKTDGTRAIGVVIADWSTKWRVASVREIARARAHIVNATFQTHFGAAVRRCCAGDCVCEKVADSGALAAALDGNRIKASNLRSLAHESYRTAPRPWHLPLPPVQWPRHSLIARASFFAIFDQKRTIVLQAL